MPITLKIFYRYAVGQDPRLGCLLVRLNSKCLYTLLHFMAISLKLLSSSYRPIAHGVCTSIGSLLMKWFGSHIEMFVNLLKASYLLTS